jgi:CRP-like cAMP-binding protein
LKCPLGHEGVLKKGVQMTKSEMTKKDIAFDRLELLEVIPPLQEKDNITNLFKLIEETEREKPKELITFLLQYGKKISFKENQIIMEEEDFSDYIYILLEGILEVTKRDKSGNEIVITQLESGSVIGEMGVFLDKKRSATVRAKTEVVLSRFTNECFIDALAQTPNLLLRLLKSFSGRIDDLNKMLTETMATKVLFVIGLMILETRKDLGKEEEEIQLDPSAIHNETNLEESKILSALNAYNKSNIVSQFKVGEDKTISFNVNYEKLRAFLKSVSYT